ncbi:MAG: hypothetical protein GW778_02375 [Alphaproteobacteria bacterium]|nr:hypothetical protein [Alphaproteobacteria bacterium]
MNFSTIKKLAVTSAVALTLFVGAPADAQVTSSITGTFATASALSTSAGTALDFGTWAINVGGTDSLTIPIAPALTGSPPVPTCGGQSDAATLCINTVPPATSGTVTVTTPTATTVQISAVISSNFVDSTLTLGSLTYTDSVVTAGAIPAVTSPGTLATTTSAAAETIAIGGTLTIAGGTPAASGSYTASAIDVSFQY